ncbi:uncharacterized protein LOC108115855 isoform X2 [Drosophila eugracilis]|uniref:uncharacterized protein LOC108115855 isoform X2 n=1 Tax=Drosophila eugracilis TaxID=29029 RepID=UPI0007E5FAA6|nr:uncharacterized protein LOC108115855 isoform X2 [Drosophila eugracilis]
MNFYVLSWLLFFLAPGGCPIYSIDLATLEVPTNDFQNELTLQSMLSSELRAYRNGLNERTDIGQKADPPYSPPRKWFKDLPTELQKTTRSTSNSNDFLGTNLFGNYRKNCFSTEDIALLSARRDFELLVPKSFPQCLLTDNVVHMILRYFNTVNQIVKQMSDEDTRLILQRAFYDALGGYLRYYLVPMAQVSYYAGRIKTNTVERLVNIYRQSRTTLNTNGNGWRTPGKDIMNQFKDMKIEPLKLPKGCVPHGDASSCALLDQSCVSQESDQGTMIVTLPRLEMPDENGFLTNIYLPFRKRRIYNLRSTRSAFVLVKFFQTLTDCYRFQGVSQINYNRQLLAWIRENLQMHYGDDIFYPGLGGVLQIKERLLIQKKIPEEESRESRALSKKDKAVGLFSSSRKESRKLSRSAINWQEPSESEHGQEKRNEWLTGLDTVQNGQDEQEECRECDNDETLIWCIAAFLALLLLIILLIICCCMRRGRKKRVPPDAEVPLPTDKSKKPKDTLVVKESESQNEVGKNEPEGARRYYYSGSGRSTSQRSIHIDGFPENTELDSYTSTSSLGCQFNRKCVPLKFSRAKGQEYYIPEKGRDGTTKNVPVVKLLSEDSSSHRPLQTSNKAVLKSTLPAIPTSESDLLIMNREKKLQQQDREETNRKKSKDSKERRKETKSSEDRKPSSSERRKTKHVRIVTDNESSDEPLLHRKQKSREKPEPVTGRQKGNTESIKDSPSWETTFDD